MNEFGLKHMPITEQLNGITFERFTPEEVKERFDRNEIVLVDVRTPQEYAFEYIAGALLFPMFSFDPHKLPLQDRKSIVFYCRSGKRSRTVAAKCSQAGISRIAHMDGGINAWKTAKYPYIAMDAMTGRYVKKNETVDSWYLIRPLIGYAKTDLYDRSYELQQEVRLHIPQTLGEIESLNSSLL